MRLRTQILSILLLFGLAPLLAAGVINLPLVVGSLEALYHRAHLQNLRADFRDLDQHLASRHEMVRLLTKLPEAKTLLGGSDQPVGVPVAMAEAHYTQWINRILPDQLDIVEILFLARDGEKRFWLERDQDTLKWRPRAYPPKPVNPGFFEAGMRVKPGGVLVSPISVNPEAGDRDPRRFMNLRLISPIGTSPTLSTDHAGEPLGAVVMSIDVSGMAQAYRDTYWVRSDGSYLVQAGTRGDGTLAFGDFAGLDQIFEKGDLALWKGPGRAQVIWVPLFATEGGGPLWVGRRVDPSPLAQILYALEFRAAAIVLILIVVVVLVARWIALRAERFGQELTDGMGKVLSGNQSTHFSWGKPEELRALSTTLNELSETHVRNTQALREHAREMEESNRYKSEFLANVSHELRTPLNSILLLSKMLGGDEDKRLSPEQSKQARVIHEAGRDLRALIDDILDLSRIEARKSAFRLERIELPALLDSLLDLVRPQAESKGLYLKLEIGAAAPRSIVSDADKLRQILKNFLSNALKFTRSGGITVRLAYDPGGAADTPPVRISVMDTGIGIPADKHEVIFDAFSQADGSTSRRYGGTGLGLTISRELSQLMGGTIELDSVEGHGASFTLCLPEEFDSSRIDAEQLSRARSPAGGAPEEIRFPEADLDGRSILIVDDDVRNLLALTPLLERWNLEVTAAGDGAEAMETLAEEEGFDLILMDIMMPGMDGYETIRRIRDQEQLRELPIIAVTAKAGHEDRDKCLAAGANDYLAKPVDPVALRDMLVAHLGSVQDKTYGTTDARP